jgi:hypothetical protein
MDEISREVIAYAIIGTVLLAGGIGSASFIRRRRLAKLRQRGIKRYGH